MSDTYNIAVQYIWM